MSETEAIPAVQVTGDGEESVTEKSSMEQLKLSIAKDHDQIIHKGMEFFDALSQKESHLEEQIRKLESAMSNLQVLTVKASRQQIAKEMKRRHIKKKPKTPTKRVLRKPQEDTPPPPPKQKKTPKKFKNCMKPKVIELSPGYVFDIDYEPKDPVSVMGIRNGPRQTTYANGDIRIEFPGGTTKTKHEGMTFTKYSNGDYQQDFEDGTTYYRYSANKSIELRLTNGDVVLLFENGQKEEHFSSGRTRITYKDGTVVTTEKDNS